MWYHGRFPTSPLPRVFHALSTSWTVLCRKMAVIWPIDWSGEWYWFNRTQLAMVPTIFTVVLDCTMQFQMENQAVHGTYKSLYCTQGSRFAVCVLVEGVIWLGIFILIKH